MKKSLNQIEKDIDVRGLRHDGKCVWPIIKTYLITLDVNNSQIVKKLSLTNIKILLNSLLSDFFSIRNVFKSDVWVFSNSERRYEINGSYFERITSSLLGYVDNYVLFENPLPNGKSKKEKLQNGEFLVGLSWVYFIQYFFMKISRKPKIDNLFILENYLQIELSNIKNIYHRYHISFVFYKTLFKIRKPKVVFIVCYYSNFGLIKACRETGIPVVELQHGIVTKEHRAYNFLNNYGNTFFPDYFFGFGEFFNRVIINGLVVNENNTLRYGYTFLNQVDKRLAITEELREVKCKFKKVICITGQLDYTDVKLLKIFDEIVDKFPDVYFVFKPRNKNSTIKFLEKENFVKWDYVNTYLLLKHCDFHVTVYSTCAIESIALGTPNISIDIEGLYTKFLKELIGDNENNYQANGKLEFVKILNEVINKQFEQDKVRNSIEKVISPMVSKEVFFDFFQKIIEDKPNHK